MRMPENSPAAMSATHPDASCACHDSGAEVMESADRVVTKGVHEALRTIDGPRIPRLEERTPYAPRVHDLLVGLGPHQTSMQEVAHALGMSVRTLRRRLSAEGAPYNGILSEAFAVVAKHYLPDKQLTIQETALELGFSSASTFHRAFKRWTGTTPTHFRGRVKRDG